MQSYIHDGLLVLSRRSCLLHRDAVGAQPPGTNQRSINNLRGTQGVLLRCTIETVRCALVSIASQPWDGETKAFLILASTWPHPICFFPWPLHYLWHLFGLAVLVVWLGTTSTNCKRGTQDNEATRGVFRRRVRIRVHPNAPRPPPWPRGGRGSSCCAWNEHVVRRNSWIETHHVHGKHG